MHACPGMTPQPRNSTRRTHAAGDDAVLRVGYILSYRDPHYIRSLSILQALRTAPDVRVTGACNTHKGLWRYIETLRSLRRLRTDAAPHIYILGFRGHEIFRAVHLMIRGAPLVFDALMSPYAALREENKSGRIGKLMAPLVHRLERRILQRADLVLTDTRLHASYYARTFSIPEAKICVVPVGAIETEFASACGTGHDTDRFSVLFYGSFLPLHGINVIVEAAALLVGLPIHFNFVGGNAKQAQQLHRQCAQLGVAQYTHRSWVSREQLLQSEIPRADLCLGGPFGDTPQARRVVTGKTSQCLALGKATVIGRIHEDYGFADRVNCLLVEQADASALAVAIRWAYENRDRLSDMGARGREVYDMRLSVHVIAERLLPALRKIAAKPPIGGEA